MESACESTDLGKWFSEPQTVFLQDTGQHRGEFQGIFFPSHSQLLHTVLS